MRAGEGYRTGYNGATPASMNVGNWITTWRSQGWDPVDVVVNLGANDSGFCFHDDVACARAAIEHLLAVIGPGHRVWWPKITRFYTYADQQNTWNTALDQIAAERDDVFTWDWPTEMRTGGYSSPDLTHLSADSYRKRSAVMAREITADLADGARTGTDAPLPVAAGQPSTFVPLAPERILDTRDGGAAPLAAGASVTIDMTPYVPDGATAVAVGLTSDRSDAPGFLTGYPCDRPRAEVSNVNHAAGIPRGAMGVVPLAADGTLCVYTSSAGHVIVDLQGAFVPGDGGVGFAPIEPSERLLDTRQTGRAATVTVQAPDGAEAVAVNLTATNVTAPGWLKAYPCGSDAAGGVERELLPGRDGGQPRVRAGVGRRDHLRRDARRCRHRRRHHRHVRRRRTAAVRPRHPRARARHPHRARRVVTDPGRRADVRRPRRAERTPLRSPARSRSWRRCDPAG